MMDSFDPNSNGGSDFETTCSHMEATGLSLFHAQVSLWLYDKISKYDSKQNHLIFSLCKLSLPSDAATLGCFKSELL